MMHNGMYYICVQKIKHSDQEKGIKVQSMEKRISQLSATNKSLDDK